MGRAPDMSRYFPLLHPRPHTVYVLKCKTPGHYYVGITDNLERRVRQHAMGRGAEFTRLHGFRSLLIFYTVGSEQQAKKVERTWTLRSRSLAVPVAGGGWSASKPPAKVYSRATNRKRKTLGA